MWATRDLALALLRGALATGEVPREEIEQLAHGWLAATGGEEAIRALEGGPTEAAAVVRLCERILAFCALLDVDDDADAAAGGA